MLLIYVDDTVIIGKTLKEVKKNMMEIVKAGESIRLRSNMEKTKCMIIQYINRV